MKLEHILIIASLGTFVSSFFVLLCAFRNRVSLREIDILGNCIVVRLSSLRVRSPRPSIESTVYTTASSSELPV